MKDNKYDKNMKYDKEKEVETSIGTPLGHMKVNPKPLNESFVGWINDILDKDEISDNHENQQKS